VAELRDSAQGSVTVSREPATKAVGFVSAGRNGDLMPGSSAKASAKADAFLNEYGAMFGATPGTLVRDSVQPDGNGGSTVTYVQEYSGVPVFGAMLRAHVDRQGDLTAVNGSAVPDLAGLSVDPGLSAAAAGQRAVAFVKAEPPGHDGQAADTTGVKAVSTDLVIYREGLVRGVAGESSLAYVVEVSNRANIRDMVFLLASSGKVVNRYSMVHDALERRVYERTYDPASVVWEEGDPFPGTLNEDQQNIVNGSGESYWFFHNVFGRDSYDGAGHDMETVNNDPRINCPNANWNGVTTNYCNGVTSDDVVAHEWGHAYTEYTHGLIYQWQPGALNESYSDIWGETIDLINGRQDDDEGDITAKRSDGLCSTHTPARPLLTINSPAEIAKDCATGGAAFGPQLDATGVTGDVALGLDADEDGDGDPNPFDLEGSVYDGCSAFTNPDELVGKIVMVNRGLCGFEVKARNIDAAGGIAAIIANRDPVPLTMSGDALPDPEIPSVSIGRDDRMLIAEAIEVDEATVNVTMKDAGGVREDSYRWLIGEDSSAFGGAIRDMWTPTCMGDPGKVTDAEYHCTTDDAGGVHSNSGVPNHGYSLLVDGGSYNGFDISGIGLTKAAHIYYRAMTQYQTPTSKFPDHADALEASCADLIGAPLTELSTAENDAQPSSEVIEAPDCEQVSAVIAAVELRTNPDQCNFQPLLQPGKPKTCGSKQSRNTFWSEDFESGLDRWELGSEWVFEDQDFAWQTTADAPKGHSSQAAYGVDPDGECSLGEGDVSGHFWMTTEPILVPGLNQKNPLVTFDHYVATEGGWDGGNVKISINGGAFEVVPAAAYTFNPYNTNLSTAAAGNTNPLAGQPAFSGTDGGEVDGTWGSSQINLSTLGVKSGDSFELQFDTGQDGCTGIDGWYVDDILVSTCKAKTATSAKRPGPVDYGRGPEVDVEVDSIGGFGPATGNVVARKGGDVIATAELQDGEATLDLPTSLRAGTHTISVRYAGDDLHAPSTDSVDVRVAKADTRAVLDLQPSPVHQGRRVVADVVVSGDGFTPGGSVVLKKGKQVVARGALNGGEKTFLFNADWKPGTYTFKVQYDGNANVKPSSDTDRLRVIR
jgi:Zn-dependent metalloprotease